ncbi:MAG: DUF131 domain-containing protein, partial [Candidatus Thorarchaeota archaeon]
SEESLQTQRESKGIILLGPIPIVWGYGKKVWIAIGFIAILLFFVLILL